MNNFNIGQRWFSENELELGLGEVVDINQRSITLKFEASDEQRIYSIHNAPITRVQFNVGDLIRSIDGWSMTVTEIRKSDGLCEYIGIREDGTDDVLNESRLAYNISLNKPQNRLLNFQVDNVNWYLIRYKTHLNYARLSRNPVFGLFGARVSLIPHQLYIARQVTARIQPRVILADEVGLGKTIEAGLILHQKIHTQSVSRVLVVVPDSLVYQWLVELLRRFNLSFSIFDESRCQALDDSSDEDESYNPFESEQLIICSLSFLASSHIRQNQVLACNWDMLIVDEAHHLYWTPEKSSAEYDLVEQLADHIPGILLLTATPEQLGVTSHFARLKLLDSKRFYDLAEFEREQRNYAKIAKIAEVLLNNEAIDDNSIAAIKKIVKNKSDINYQSLCKADGKSTKTKKMRGELINLLLDCHGTSRVFFRNTRNTITGFPKRIALPYELDSCDQYNQCINKLTKVQSNQLSLTQYLDSTFINLLLTPEIIYQSIHELGEDNNQQTEPWVNFDPRVPWLVQFLKNLKNQKVLVICANKFTVLELDSVLRKKQGIRVAVFHENLSILERDKAAAYFSSIEKGAQVLICSEIGSEGRNFQFAHHLVLFDLPSYPDLLEQRIGRLDRIGQKQDINIHIPYLKNSAQEKLFRWYHEGLNSFSEISLSGQTLYEQYRQQLHDILVTSNISPRHKTKIDLFIADTKKSKKRLDKKLQSGRDKLLELNSYNSKQAKSLVSQINEIDSGSALFDYVKNVSDICGIDFESHDKFSYVMKPSSHMYIENFPELPADGVTLTFNREHALQREDIRFVTWEHPMIIAIMELLIANEYGNAAIMVSNISGIDSNTVLLECIYKLECTAPKRYQVNAYLPGLIIHSLVDENLHDLSDKYSIEDIPNSDFALNKEQIKQFVTLKKESIDQMLIFSEKNSFEKLPKLIRSSIKLAKQTFGQDIKRLEELKEVNPNVSDTEITLLRTRQSELISHLQNNTTLRLDSLRLILNQ